MSMSALRETLPSMLTVEQVQRILNIGRTLAYQIVRDGTLPGVVTIGKATRRVLRDELLDWIETRGDAADAAESIKRPPGRPKAR